MGVPSPDCKRACERTGDIVVCQGCRITALGCARPSFPPWVCLGCARSACPWWCLSCARALCQINSEGVSRLCESILPVSWLVCERVASPRTQQ
jgi:hypothetical protein